MQSSITALKYGIEYAKISNIERRCAVSHEPYIRIVPGSDTAVLMVHGIVGTPRHFDGIFAAIPENWCVYNILLDGHGGGVRDFASASMEIWRKQVSSILNALCVRYKRIFIVAHSMGTLLTMEAALEHKNKVAGILFLASPLKIGVKPRAALYALQLAFELDKPNSRAAVMRRDCGVELSKKLWLYLGWIPRYLELFRQSKKCRELVKKLDMPCTAIQSKNDELVSRKSVKYLAANPKIEIHELERSGHFGYVPEEQSFINNKLKELFEGVKK